VLGCLGATLFSIVLHWFRDRRRKKLLEQPFPDGWDKLISHNLAHDAWLDEAERGRLRDLTRIFVAEKKWEGCGGLVLEDEIRVTIAANACLLILGRSDDLYRNVRSILVYPSTVVIPERQAGAFEVPRGDARGPIPILGEAKLRGPVILVWDAVQRQARHPERGHNVVFHEFAHKLDMRDGGVDGTPPLESRDEYRRWVEVCEREYRSLRERAEKGQRSLLDVYGATNEAEFFAVATELFFDQPISMRKRYADLYEILQAFYRQDPAARVERRCGAPERRETDP